MSLLQMSFSASIMILVVIVIRALAINKLPKRTFIALWGIVLMRLLIPFSMPSPFSVYSVINNHTAVTEQMAGTPVAYVLPLPINTQMLPNELTETSSLVTNDISPWMIIWIAGLVICGLFFAISYVKCYMEFQASLPVKSDMLDTWLANHKTIRPIRIMQSGRISTPLTYGIFRPVILISKKTDLKNEKQLQYILIHEYVHIRRFDAVTKILLTVTLCIHWFNPLVWAMYILSNRDIELSCDEAVVRHFGETEKSSYALVLVSMEEKRNGISPLYNNFSKNAIEERITAIMKIKKTSLIAGLLAVVLITGVTTVFATTANADKVDSLSAISDTAFTTEEYDKLISLQIDGYQDMTIAEYREKALTLMDTEEYVNLIERMWQDEQLQNMRYTNETANFLFNTLIPITAENWEQRDFGNYVQSSYSAQTDGGILEYSITRTILDADRLTVGEHDRAIQGVMNGLNELWQSKNSTELQDETLMNTAIQTEVASLKNQWGTEALRLEISYFFMPLIDYNVTNENSTSSNASEERGTPGTENDYQSLLTLKTPDYKNQSVASFNASLLEWANDNYDSMERIGVDVATNDIHVSLTDEERLFVTLTTIASGEENTKLIQSHYTGRPEETLTLGWYILSKVDGNGGSVQGDYLLSYDIANKDELTISERDNALLETMNDIQRYWDGISMEEAQDLNKETLVLEFQRIADMHSTSNLKINIPDVFYEAMNEPSLNY